MRVRLGFVLLTSAAALALGSFAPASAGECDRLIHATIQGVGHVCLGPDPIPPGI